MYLIDTHCHLDFPDFSDELPDVVARAEEAGVGIMISIGTHLNRSLQVKTIAERFENVYCSVGIHPHEAANERLDGSSALVAEANHRKVVALGETGLDYFYDHSPRDIQQSNFRYHIAAARETGLPVVIHTRDADDDMQAILREEMREGAFKAVIHCFSSSRALAEAALELGLYLSMSGIVTFSRSEELRAIARDIPLDRLLVETDAPFLAPVPKRGKRNEPAFTAHTARLVAEVKGISYSELAQATTRNALCLFDKISPSSLSSGMASGMASEMVGEG